MFVSRKHLSAVSAALFKRFGSSLVIADHNNKTLNAATLSSITAAKKFGSVHVLVAGSDCAAVATEVSKAAGVDGVIVADKPALANFLPETLAAVLKEIIAAGKYTHVVGATTSSIKSVIPRLAVAMNVSPITDVIAIKVAYSPEHRVSILLEYFTFFTVFLTRHGICRAMTLLFGRFMQETRFPP